MMLILSLSSLNCKPENRLRHLCWLRAPCVWITDIMTCFSTPHRDQANKQI
jgi:hypothetical protein